MKQKLVSKNDIINLLIKKANGFYYAEEQLEFERKNLDKKGNNQVDFFNYIDFQKNAKSDIKLCKNIKKTAKINKININKSKNIANFNQKFGNLFYEKNIESILKNNSSKNVVTVSSKMEKSSDIMKMSNATNFNFQDENLILIKRKVSNHYIPPDMVAIKILFDYFDKNVDENDVENMSDTELLNFKRQLLEELKNENIEDI